ncbi:attractin-like protein 1 [Haematobia irritans]|uniref:attractin-like protein 1 n=1 Tax=Haematobia irritans TaxID=7368 RepID=UPI003F504A81
MEGIANMSKKHKKDCPSHIALEPCSGNRAAVLSLLVRLPTGGLQHAPAGQPAGLAVASALVTLGNPRRSSIDHTKSQNLSVNKVNILIVVHNRKRTNGVMSEQSTCVFILLLFLFFFLI